MKGFIIASLVVIMGGMSVYVLAAFGVPKAPAAAIGISISVIGFICQLAVLFGTKRAHERQMREARMRHESMMAEVSSLPPAQALDLLLKNIR